MHFSLAAEWHVTGEHDKDENAKRPHVDSTTVLSARKNLRSFELCIGAMRKRFFFFFLANCTRTANCVTHVRRSSNKRHELVAIAKQIGKTKIGDFDLSAVLIDKQNVFGLDITMSTATFVQIIESLLKV